MKERVAPFISPSFIVQMTRSIALIGFPEKLKNGIETFFPSLLCALLFSVLPRHVWLEVEGREESILRTNKSSENIEEKF